MTVGSTLLKGSISLPDVCDSPYSMNLKNKRKGMSKAGTLQTAARKEERPKTESTEALRMREPDWKPFQASTRDIHLRYFIFFVTGFWNFFKLHYALLSSSPFCLFIAQSKIRN